MSTPPSLRVLGLSLAALCACQAPPVVPTQDTAQAPEAANSRIDGSVVVTGKGRGNVIVLLYDAANLPPPQGTGRPVGFDVIPEATVFGKPVDTSNGPFTAPFTFSRVKPGHSYIIRGFVDQNECATSTSTLCHGSDFIPWFFATNETNRGDVGGAAVDIVSRQPRLIKVDDAITPITGITVSFNDAATAVDRPVFFVSSNASESAPLTFTTSGLTLELLPRPIVDDSSRKVVNASQPVFITRFVDDNGDGQPDDANADGRPEVWPKVLIRKLDSNREGNLVEETGQHYPHVDGSVSKDGDVVVLAAGLNPADLYPLLTDAGGAPKRDTLGQLISVPVPPTQKLKVVISPVALDASNPAKPVPLTKVPSGRYALILVNPTGQTWRIPNETQPGSGPGQARSYGEVFAFPEVASQAVYLNVP